MVSKGKGTKRGKGKGDPAPTVFLSWSGELSRCVALLFRDFMNELFTTSDITFISCEDIKLGQKWAEILFKHLENDNLGIVFVTKENLTAPWLHYEFGALSKEAFSRVIPVLIDLNRNDVDDTPIGQFQSAISIKKENICKLMTGICKHIKPSIRSKTLSRRFKKNWNKLRRDIEDAKRIHAEDVRIDSVNYKTMRHLLDTCENSREAVFFNVQMDLAEWFDPNMQIHLAMQDSASRFEQLEILLNKVSVVSERKIWSKRKIPRLRKHFGTPSSRVMFVPQEENELKREVTDAQSPYSKLLPLSLIHLFIGCPLVIVTIDRFSDIVKKEENRDFFGNKEFTTILGLPFDLGSEKMGHDERCKELKGAFSRMKIEVGKITPNIDFAVFLDKRGEIGDVWGGSVELKKHCIAYFPITTTLHKKRGRDNIFEYRLDNKHYVKLELSAARIKNGRTYLRALTAFAKVIMREVFCEGNMMESNHGDLPEARRAEKLHKSANPVVRAFRNRSVWHGRDVVRKVNPKYCPFSLLADSGAFTSLHELTEDFD